MRAYAFSYVRAYCVLRVRGARRKAYGWAPQTVARLRKTLQNAPPSAEASSRYNYGKSTGGWIRELNDVIEDCASVARRSFLGGRISLLFDSEEAPESDEAPDVLRTRGPPPNRGIHGVPQAYLLLALLTNREQSSTPPLGGTTSFARAPPR